MKTNVPIKKQPVEAKTHSPDIQRRINAGWLNLWKAVYPNTPPPVQRGKQKAESRRRLFVLRTNDARPPWSVWPPSSRRGSRWRF
jgi:hypothetical protein